VVLSITLFKILLTYVKLPILIVFLLDHWARNPILFLKTAFDRNHKTVRDIDHISRRRFFPWKIGQDYEIDDCLELPLENL
jgi:hypothetical protein